MQENQDNLTLSFDLTPLLAGYIEVDSPYINQLKQEVLQDGYLTTLFGGLGSTDQDYIDVIRAFSYLWQKHNIKIGVTSVEPYQYVRNIDEVFHVQQAYSMEAACALASWCISLGLDTHIVQIPGYTYNYITLPSGKQFPFDATYLSVWIPQFPDPNLPREEYFDAIDANTQWILKDAMTAIWDDDWPRIEANDFRYSHTSLQRLRQYMPSFNLHNLNWWENRSRSRAATSGQLQIHRATQHDIPAPTRE